MIAITTKQNRQHDGRNHANERFLTMLPKIRRQARQAFRRAPAEPKDELVEEVVAHAFVAYVRLVDQGKASAAFATPLCNYAIRRVLAGRRVGSKLNIRDVSSVVAQRRRGFSVHILPSESSNSDAWCEILTDDTLTPVPDQVAFRLDFPVWLKIQDRRKRELAQFLMVGNTATEAAKRFHVSIPRICQLRRELQASWQAFQGESS